MNSSYTLIGLIVCYLLIGWIVSLKKHFDWLNWFPHYDWLNSFLHSSLLKFMVGWIVKFLLVELLCTFKMNYFCCWFLNTFIELSTWFDEMVDIILGWLNRLNWYFIVELCRKLTKQETSALIITERLKSMQNILDFRAKVNWILYHNFPFVNSSNDIMLSQKFCDILLTEGRHISAAPDVFPEVMKVTNNTELWDFKLAWYKVCLWFRAQPQNWL